MIKNAAIFSVMTGAICCAGFVSADEVTLAQILQQDGPYIDIPAGFEVATGPPDAQAIRAMADLDGDPSVITAQEQQMIKLLEQVLLSTPISY